MSHARATGPSGISDNEPYIYKKGPAFGMPGVLVDGMDVRKVRCMLRASGCWLRTARAWINAAVTVIVFVCFVCPHHWCLQRPPSGER